ncbi:RelA/SpoT domain-containing protein [Acinetobacter guillouiae]|uniref:RelA/SpoT domain-containing protein n=1 Tax=Acinetobacter guillouiae TaxID=106649 RepID=UPI002FDA71F7
MNSNRMRKNQISLLMKFSKKDVVRAGEALINDDLTKDDEAFQHTMAVLTYWRNSHIVPLNLAHDLLHRFIHRIDKKAFVAKRLKRFDSVKKKLQRFEQMQLKNMQDIGGIRVVVSNLAQVDSIFKILINEHCFYNNNKLIKVDNYIENPKVDGYRCLHMVGKFTNESNEERKIEFQIRTKLQHSWATALEIVDIFTDQNLKSNSGFLFYKNFFKDVSDQFQLMENLTGFKNNNREDFLKEYLNKVLADYTLTRQCIDISKILEMKTGLFTFEEQLRKYCKAAEEINQKLMATKYKDGFVLIRLNVDNHKIEHEFFNRSEHDLATIRYGQYEKLLSNNKKMIITLLSTDAVGGLKEAYPNYFADSEIFLDNIRYIKMVVGLSEFDKLTKQLSISS